ncbi:Hint domain-containing protein [Rhizobium terrae]|uniref:Hint domain-containing protein n=1 Tax=Rhizobium terrae TaxID=2171756 RepID=UPI000E3E7FDA|nr:Hint domain-containing protein [Rhizobium terrae]
MNRPEPQLSTRDRELLLKFAAIIEENGGAIIHDMQDLEHRAFVKLMHNICGNSEEDFPGLHAMLDEPASTDRMFKAEVLGDGDSGWVTAFGVPEAGFLSTTSAAAAKGYGTVVGGFQTCNLSLLVLAPNGTFLANGSTAGYAPLNSLAVQTNQNTAKQYVPGSTAMMTYSYQSSGGPVSGTVQGNPGRAVSDPVVTEPKRENGNTNPYNANAICIGLGRPTDLTRCDYVYDEPTQDNPIGRLPLVGNATFNYPIKALQPTSNFLVDIYVIRTDTGGQSTQLDPTDMNNVYANFNIAPGDGKTLTWNLPMKPNTQPPAPPQTYNPVVFSNIPWATEMVSYLTCNITVVLDDGSSTGVPVTVTIQSSDMPDNDPIDGVTYIMPIEFVWHCLGEDTLVTMADGSRRKMNGIKAGDLIGAAEGSGPATVSVTHNARHFHDVVVLETEGGKTLAASSEHLIFTTDGPVAAGALKPGAKLITTDGTDALRATSTEAGGGRVLWNLSLGEAPQIDDPNAEVGQFFANDILVGDARAMRALRYRQINDQEWVKTQVPASFERDVESTFRRRQKVVMR